MLHHGVLAGKRICHHSRGGYQSTRPVFVRSVKETPVQSANPQILCLLNADKPGTNWNILVEVDVLAVHTVTGIGFDSQLIYGNYHSTPARSACGQASRRQHPSLQIAGMEFTHHGLKIRTRRHSVALLEKRCDEFILHLTLHTGRSTVGVSPPDQNCQFWHLLCVETRRRCAFCYQRGRLAPYRFTDNSTAANNGHNAYRTDPYAPVT